MKQISTPSLKRLEVAQSYYDDSVRPSKLTLEFIKGFARACRPLQMSRGALDLSTIVVN